MIKDDAKAVSEIVRDSGGKLVGRTKLQKIGYLLKVAGVGADFSYVYKHYGPYSEQLATAASTAKFIGNLEEETKSTAWGGTYSEYRVLGEIPEDVNPVRRELLRIASLADSVELELAATALFLYFDGEPDAWSETERRKPEKASGDRLSRSKELYNALRAVVSDNRFPELS